MAIPPFTSSLQTVPSSDDALEASEREAAALHARFQRARTARVDYDYRWFVAKQWYNNDTTNFYRPGVQGAPGKVVSKESKRTPNRGINLFAHAIDLIVAKQIKARPTPTTKPGTDPRRRAQARACKAALRNIYRVNRITKNRRTLLLDRALYGGGFLKVWYDPVAAIGPFADDIRPCPMCRGSGVGIPPEAMQQLEQTAAMAADLGMPPPPQPPQCSVCRGAKALNHGSKPLGEVRAEFIPVWQVYPLDAKGRIEDGLFHSYVIKKEAAIARFSAYPGFDPEKLKSSQEWMASTNKSFFEQQDDTSVMFKENDKDCVRVIELWEPPSPGSERPFLTIVVGNIVVRQRQEILEPYRRVPWFHFRLRAQTGEFWPSTMALDMIEMNDRVNASANNHDKHEALMAFAKYMTQMGSVSKDQFTTKHGEVVEYTGEKPSMLQPVGMPDWLFRKQENYENKVYSLAGLQDLDRGIPPPNIEAHNALQFLTELSEQIHGPVLVDDEDTWIEAFECMLECAMTNYKEEDERWVDIVGSVHPLQVELIKEPRLIQKIGVTCEVASALAHSTALRQENVRAAAKEGMFAAAGIPGDRVLELMEFGSIVGESHSDYQQQDELALAENMAMLSGAPHEALPRHDHAVHIRCHRVAAAQAQAEGDLAAAAAITAAIVQHMQAAAMEAAGGTAMAPPAGDGGVAPAGPAPFDSGEPSAQDAGTPPR